MEIKQIQLDPASRHYRQAFTPKYQSLWPGQYRLLSVDVLEASNQQMIFMNGRWFEFSPKATCLAGHMRHAWAELGRLLKRLNEEQLAARPWDVGLKAEMRRALEELDAAWASFERACVMEVMAIEEQARVLLAEACIHERALFEACRCRDGDDRPGVGRTCQRQLGKLVRQLSLLSDAACAENEVRAADWRLVTRALLQAKSILEPARLQNHHQRLDPAHALATRANDAFEAVQDYLRSVWHCLESVDGQLSNNPGLVTQLTHFWESLSATARYLTDPRLLRGLHGAASFVRAACAVAPELATMGAECDADFFLVLPRIVWLGFLSAPDQNGPVIEHVLPELFPEPQVRGPVLRALIKTYDQTVSRLAVATGDGHPALEGGGPEGRRRAIDMLVQRAVVGVGQECGGPRLGHSRGPPASAAVPAAAEDFLRHLEGWSMRLQRQQPEVWNELAAALLWHLLD